jgi:hypothetical protein
VLPTGDINGDGCGDALITSASSVVTLVFGCPVAGTSTIVLPISSVAQSAGINIGYENMLTNGFGPAGDFNMDGIDDFLVGIPYGNMAGAVLLVFGKTSGWADINAALIASGSAGVWVLGAAAGGSIRANTVGDVNGDGASDIAAVRNCDASACAFAPVAYVIFGRNSTVTAFQDIDLAAFQSGSRGFKVIADKPGGVVQLKSAGDFNNDGYGDILIFPFEGKSVYVVFGHSPAITYRDVKLGTLRGADGFVIDASSPDASSGWYTAVNSVSRAGDFNDDGISDIVIGCPFYSTGSVSQSGRVFILFGHSATSPFRRIDLAAFSSGTAGLAVRGRSSGDYLGFSVDGGGDVNRDGIDDVILSAVGADPLGRADAGMAVVLFGRRASSFATVDLAAGLTSSFGFKIYMSTSYGADRWSISLGLEKSFGGDGNGDIVVGNKILYDGRNMVPSARPTKSPTARPTVFGCFPGTHYQNETSQGVCVDCLAGHYSDAKGLPVCSACPPGQEAPSSGSTECAECAVGRFADRNGTARCSKCAAGSYIEVTGATACKMAPPGGYVDSVGATTYQLCPADTYSPTHGSANASCIACPGGRVTANLGSGSLSDCFLPHTNFLFAGLALALAVFVISVYILAGRVHSIAYGRMRFIREAKEQYQWLIESVQRLEQAGNESTRRAGASPARIFGRRMRPVAWVAAEAAVLVYGVLSSSLFILGKVFFFAMVIWRNIHFQFPHPNFMDQIASALDGIGDVVGPTLLAVVRAIASACNWFAMIPVDLSAAEVTCQGGAGMLLIDVCIFVRVICLVDCDIAVFLQTTFGDAHEAFRRALTLPHLEALLPYDFRTKVWLWLCSYVESSVLSPSVVVTVLQLLLGFVSIGEFFAHGGIHAYTQGCNNVQNFVGYDKMVALISSGICYYLIIPVAYTVLKFLVPRLRERRPDQFDVAVEEKVAVEAQLAMGILRTGQRARALEWWVSDALGKQAAACKEASTCARALATARRAVAEDTEAREVPGDVLVTTQNRLAEAEAHVKVARGYVGALQAQLAGGYRHVYDSEIQAAEDEVQHAVASAAAACAVAGLSPRKSLDGGRACSDTRNTAPTTPHTPYPLANKDQSAPQTTPSPGLCGQPARFGGAVPSGYAEVPVVETELKGAHAARGEEGAAMDATDPSFGSDGLGEHRGQGYEILPPPTPRTVLQQLRETELNCRIAMRDAERAMVEAMELAEATVAAAKDAEEGLQQMSKLEFYAAQDIDGLHSRILTSSAPSCLFGPFTDSVRPLVSLLQPDDSWLSWRFQWAFKALNFRTPRDSQAFVFPLSAELRRSLHCPRRMGPILYMPWSTVPEDEVQSQMRHQVDWNAERFNRLPPCGFLPVIACHNYIEELLLNLKTLIEIYFCGVWYDDSVQMLGLRDLLDSCGLDGDASTEVHGDTVASALYRVVTCGYGTGSETKRRGAGNSRPMSVSSILYAKLVPRVTLCLLFPYGAFVTTFVNNTVAYPLWCHSPYLNDRLPRILVFEAWALAEERVAEGGNRVYWKVLFTAINIFVLESRLIGYLFGLLQYLMTLAVLFFPSRGFLAFGTVLIGIYSLCSSLRLMVSVAHIFEVSEIKVHPHDSADPADDATDVEAPGDQHGARLLAAVKDIRAHTSSQVAAPKPFSTCATCGAMSAHGEACVCSKTQPPAVGR